MPLPDTKNAQPSNDDFEQVEDGWYQVRITKFKEWTSQAGNKWIKLWLKSPNFGGFAWLDVSLNPNKLGKLKMLKDCLGLADDANNPESLIDGRLWAYCFSDEKGYGKASKIANIQTVPPALQEEQIFYSPNPEQTDKPKTDDDDLPF